jgi:TolB protein
MLRPFQPISPVLCLPILICVVLCMLIGMTLASARGVPPGQLPTFWVRESHRTGLYVIDRMRGMSERIATAPDVQIVDVPRTSANGHRLVFEAARDGRLHIRAEDSARLLYTTDSAFEDRLPGWSSDGTRLAFWSNRMSTATTRRWQNWNIFILDVERNAIRQVTSSLGCIPYDNPLWSPDSTLIAAQYWCAGGENGTFIIDTETGETRNIRAVVDAGGDLVWSPSGQRIAFRTDRDRNGEIYIYDLTAGTLVNVTRSAGTDFQPTWSPDESRIAFVSTREGHGDIFVVTLATGAVQRLTEQGAWKPVWSPDGRWITFTSDQDGVPGLYAVEPDGSNLHFVAAINEEHQFLGWYAQDA